MMYTKSVDRKRTGLRFPIPEKRGTGITLYNNVGGRLLPGDIVVVKHSSTAGQEWQGILPATLAVYQYVAVAYEIIEKATIGKFILSGQNVDIFASGKTDITLGGYLEVLNRALSATTITSMVITAGTPPATTRAKIDDATHDWDTDLFLWGGQRIVLTGWQNAANNETFTTYSTAPVTTDTDWDIQDYSTLVTETGSGSAALYGLLPATLDHATARSVDSFAMAQEAYTTDICKLIKCVLFGEPVIIAAT
jgi:hypothetical protein